MVRLEPVIEAPSDAQTPLWPTLAEGPADGWIHLSAHTPELEIGTAVLQLAIHKNLADGGSAADVLGGLASAEYLEVPGGLLVIDTATGVTIAPGCCAGLEQWWFWQDVSAFRSPCFGHDPDGWVEHCGETFRVWSEGGTHNTRQRIGPCIDIPAVALPALLSRVQEDLRGFVQALERWAAGIAPIHARPLAAALDGCLHLSEPLEIGSRRS
jgi:hypothetical protein